MIRQELIKSKLLVLCILNCLAIQLEAAIKPSIYDPMAKLNPAEVNRIEAEGSELIATRKVNGQDLLIQIDFLSEAEFKEGGIEGVSQSGRTLFSLGTYSQWSLKYFNEPAVLMLFLDAGGGNYQLDALNFSDMLMDEGIPDLVRKYIRDEIMKKESNLAEVISSGFHAIGEALNTSYEERLKISHLQLFSGDQFKRRYSYYFPFNYYEFEPYHSTDNKNSLLPDQVSFVNNKVYFDWNSISYAETEELVFPATGEIVWYDHYLNNPFNVPVLRDIIDHPLTDEKNEELITNTFRNDLIEIATNPFHYKNTDLSRHAESLLKLAFEGKYEVDQKYRLDRFDCRLKVNKKTLEKQWEYIPDVINRSIYANWGPKGPTWCNQYIASLSGRIFGKTVIESMNANDLHDYMSINLDYIEINNFDFWDFVKDGYMVFLVWKNPSGQSGHIEILLPNNTDTIDSQGTMINTGSSKYSVGAGSVMYSKQTYTTDDRFDKFLFLGHLKK